jgi:hypothetical protein
MSTIPVAEIDINYTIDGAGEETVVLVNGLADDLSIWDLQIPAPLDAGLPRLTFPGMLRRSDSVCIRDIPVNRPRYAEAANRRTRSSAKTVGTAGEVVVIPQHAEHAPVTRQIDHAGSGMRVVRREALRHIPGAAGMDWREVCGSDGLPGAERLRDKSMPGNR